MKRTCGLLAAGVVLAVSAAPAVSQSYPVKPVRLVVGFAPGGSTDVVARMLAQKLTGSFGQTVLVDNRPGASSNIAAQAVARSPADGYTLVKRAGVSAE